ncbi:MAG: prolyl oligopeptidase family serine peptidase [Rhizobiaceae bacterium]|nr:prolyl oligopeptidase family serine peptidase [Rhizobiaceae bacterium]
MWKLILAAFAAILTVSIAAAFWVWGPVAATHPAVLNGNLPSTIPLRDLYANRDARWAYSLSRDGEKLAWLEVEWFKPVLKVKDLKTGKTATLDIPKNSGHWRYYWAPDRHSMLLVLDRSGKERYEIAINDFENEQSGWKFFDFGEATNSFIQFVPKTVSDEIIIAHNGKNSRYFEFYKLNLKSRETNPLGVGLEGQQISYAIDDDGNIFGRTVKPDDQGNWRVEAGTPQTGWREILRGSYDDSIDLFGKLNDDNSIYGISNLGLNTRSLVKIDLTSGEQEVVFSDSDVDVGWVHLDPRNNDLQMIKTYREIVETRFFDEDFKRDVGLLGASDTAEIRVLSNTSDYSKSIYEIFDIKTAAKTVLLDRDNNQTSELTQSIFEQHRESLPVAEAVFIEARDGEEIPAYLYRSQGITEAGPMVIIVHGGPISRHYANSDIRFIGMLANRGYTVLDVNYRGSWGYGRKFAEMAKGEIAGKMSSDVIDARNWAVNEGIADPDAIGIFGISWGGFEVMTALTQNSDLFAAGININGVADLSTMHLEVPKTVSWDLWKEWLKEYGADPETSEGQAYLKERSPIQHAEKMTTPLLVVQAGNDVRVVQGQSDRLVAELRKHGAPVEYQLIAGVGHSPFGWPWQKRYLLYHDIERFFAKHLGGRAGGFDYAILGAHLLPE